MKFYESEEVELKEIYTTDGDSFEMNRSMVQELTFNALSNELEKRNLEFTQVQMENLGIIHLVAAHL